jgi:hypothetical protein
VTSLNEIPKKALRLYLEGCEEGHPTAVAKHPKYGYAVIATGGQGPMFVWVEKDLKKEPCEHCHAERCCHPKQEPRNRGTMCCNRTFCPMEDRVKDDEWWNMRHGNYGIRKKGCHR